MIEINLLPQEYRKKEPRFKGIDISQLNLQSIPVMHIIAGVVACLVLAQATVMLLEMYGQGRVAALTKRRDSLLPGKKEHDSLKARVTDESKRIAAIDELMVKRFSWARKLNVLSDSLTPGIWLSTLSYDERVTEKMVPAPRSASGGKKPVEGEAPPMVRQASTTRILILTGYAAGAGEQGLSLVGKFIKSMKENPDFIADFSDIVLGSSKSEKVEGQDVMNFKISCMFKEAGK